MRRCNRQSGFSMIETLIALTLFSLGFIGVAQFTGQAIKSTSDNNSRAMSLSTMSQLMSPLYVAALGTNTAFQTALNSFITGVTVNANNNRETYTVTVLEAQDDAGTNLLVNPPAASTWISPITVGVSVTYSGATGTITSTAPYTFQL